MRWRYLGIVVHVQRGQRSQGVHNWLPAPKPEWKRGKPSDGVKSLSCRRSVETEWWEAWRLKEPALNPRPYEWCNFSLVSAITMYTRSFSSWSIARIEPPLEPAPPPVSEMAVKSMGTNEIKLLGGSEEQMIFLWLITHCKRICAGHITSESISLPRLVSSG